MMSAVCAVSASLHPVHRSPLEAQVCVPKAQAALPTSQARVDRIRQHFDQQRQQWEDHVSARCSHVWTKSQSSGLKQCSADTDSDSTDSDKDNVDAETTSIPALRLVGSDHVTSSSRVTWTVTYDIRDFLKSGSVEVHCDPEGIVVTACMDAGESRTGSLTKRKCRSTNKVYKETFLIAGVDHSSLRVKSQPNGLMKITVSSKALGRNPSKRIRAS